MLPVLIAMFGWAVISPIVLALVLASPRDVLAHGDLNEQIAAVTARIESQPRRADLYLKRGELHRAHRDCALALADYDRASALDPGLASVDLARATLGLDADRLETALAAIERFLDRRPDHADGRALHARILARLGRPLEAAEEWARAIATTSRPRPEYYLERAHALAAVDRIDEALATLDEGLWRLGSVVTLELAATEMEVSRARYDAALTRVDRLAAAAPLKEQWFLQRGVILERAGRPAEAREAFAAALKAVETLPEARRRTRAVEDIETRSRNALQRLEEKR
jgi:tetratricopeptide (TPR) repeat protein